MTKSTGVGRGGPRKGAGRKPQGTPAEARPKAPKPVRAASVAKGGPVGLEQVEAASALALATLEQVMQSSPSDAARVSAARELRAWREAEREAQGIGGKKAQAQAKAEAQAKGGGRFAPPSAPTVVPFPNRA